jgi:hypothetical protein
MPNYINGILEEAPPDIEGTAVTPAAANLFTVHDDVEKLDDERDKTYHHLTARLLFLCKQARPDLQADDTILPDHASNTTR